MELAPGISVIICTHNPRPHYLARVLDSLRAQTLSNKLWELLLIDNKSDEPVAARWELSWHSNGRHIREDEIGLTPARLRGVKESKGELLVFFDDDNVLDDSYLAEAYDIARSFPRMGIWGGRIKPEFEAPPPGWIMNYPGILALRDVERDVGTTDPMNLEAVPWGAGICVRREVAVKFSARCQEPLIRALGRTGKNLTSCEDMELAWVACEAGFESGLFSRLGLIHLIPKSRTTMTYFTRWMEGNAYSYVILKAAHGIHEHSSRVFLRHWRDQAKRLLFFRFREYVLRAAARRGEKQAFRVIHLNGKLNET